MAQRKKSNGNSTATAPDVVIKSGVPTITVEMVTISKDKLWRYAKEHLDGNNINCFTLFVFSISLTIVLLTATFHDGYLPGATIQAAFLILCIIIWIATLVYFCKWWKNKETLDEFVEKCHKGEMPPDVPNK